VTFVNPETFTDIPQGERRTADLVARVRTLLGDPELVLVHAEAQRKREPDFPRRMWEYYHLLRQRERLPVIPIAANVSRRRARRALIYRCGPISRWGRLAMTARAGASHPVSSGA